MIPVPTIRRYVRWSAVFVIAAALPVLAQPAAPPAAPALTPELVDKARQAVVEASLGEDPALRSNAIEAVSIDPARALPLVTRGLTDPNPGVRFAAVVTAGRLRFNQLAPSIEPLVDDPDNASVRAAALFALHSMGRQVDITPLAAMLQDRDPRLRANVALLLGLMGDKTAVPMLRTAASAPMHRSVSAPQAAVVRIQIAEAIALLDEESRPDALRAGAYSPHDEVQVLAINAMGAVVDRQMERALVEFLLQPPVEIQIAAAASLARMGNADGLPVVRQMASHEDPIVRSQAAWALGWFGESPEAIGLLTPLIDDPSPYVRIAASSSVLRHARTARLPDRTVSASPGS